MQIYKCTTRKHDSPKDSSNTSLLTKNINFERNDGEQNLHGKGHQFVESFLARCCEDNLNKMSHIEAFKFDSYGNNIH